ncbi:hypothetical protein DHEL01_v212207 [Diaporthe helianthi]|uniref:Uncharacterized protein n=1 Tax=Diaporthe helianthi TaxID=158607 RepID=A0A2P5HGN4_DIAHE|nr:hypothetical protein DHEL01_v212207 [Diaporthe helianthi]
MYISNVTQTAVAASTALTLIPTSITTTLQTSVYPPNSTHVPTSAKEWCGTPSPSWAPIGPPPSTPDFFLKEEERPEVEVDDDGPMRRCIKKSIQIAGRDHYAKISSEEKYPNGTTPWSQWTRENRAPWYLGADKLDVDALTDKVLAWAVEDHFRHFDDSRVGMNPCGSIFEDYQEGDTVPLLDEIIRVWLWREGVFKEPTLSYPDGMNPPHHPPVERRYIDLDATNGNHTEHVLISGNSTHPFVVLEVENNVTSGVIIQKNQTGIHFKWGVVHNITIGDSIKASWPILITQLLKGSPAVELPPIPNPADQYPGPRYAPPPPRPTGPVPGHDGLHGRSTLPVNSTSPTLYGWVPVPAGNSSSAGADHYLNHTQKYHNSSVAPRVPAWLWTPMPVIWDHSLGRLTGLSLDGRPRLLNSSTNTTWPGWGATALPSHLAGPKKVVTSPRRGSSSPHHHHPNKTATADFHNANITSHDIILSAFDEFKQTLEILYSGGNLTTTGHGGSLSARSEDVRLPFHAILSGADKLLNEIFNLIDQQRRKHAAKDKSKLRGSY